MTQAECPGLKATPENLCGFKTRHFLNMGGGGGVNEILPGFIKMNLINYCLINELMTFALS